jgi:hypothetical protein
VVQHKQHHRRFAAHALTLLSLTNDIKCLCNPLLPLLLCMHVQDTTDLPASEASALLQLAMNCSNPATANTAAGCLPEQLNEGIARQLLLTAAARQHTEAVLHMISLPGMQQHIDAATLEAMIMQLLHQDECLAHLCPAPAAAQLSSEAAVRLLLEATKQRMSIAVFKLIRLAGAQQMSTSQMMGLLEACMESCTDASIELSACLQAVCSLPAAAALASSDAVQLLQVVFQRNPSTAPLDGPRCMGNSIITTHLMQLPAAAELSSFQVVQLLRVAVTCEHMFGIRSLCGLHKARQLSSEMLLQPLQLAVQHCSTYGHCCLVMLCELLAAQQLSSHWHSCCRQQRIPWLRVARATCQQPRSSAADR